MKKWLIRLLAGGLAVGLCTASAYAWGGEHGTRLAARSCGAQACASQSCRFTDNNGDGLCDLCGAAAGGKSCRLAADSLAEGTSTPAAEARNFCYGDTDGDGVCDLCGQAAGSCVCGSGSHHGRSQTAGAGTGGHHGHHAGGDC